MTFMDRLNSPKFDFTYNLSGRKIFKFQQSQALTSHFESFWSIVAPQTMQTHKLFAFFRASTIILEKISKLFTDALILEYKYQWLVKMIPCCIKDAKAKWWGSIMVFYVESKTRISDTRNLHLVNNNTLCSRNFQNVKLWLDFVGIR